MLSHPNTSQRHLRLWLICYASVDILCRTGVEENLYQLVHLLRVQLIRLGLTAQNMVHSTVMLKLYCRSAKSYDMIVNQLGRTSVGRTR
jgi:hypothetical protein